MTCCGGGGKGEEEAHEGGWWRAEKRVSAGRGQSRTATGKAATVKMASKGKLKTMTTTATTKKQQ